MRPAPGWRRLVRHSYRLGAGWLARAPRTSAPEARQGLVRLLVPLDPWRFWELGRVAEESFAGRVLDVGSPKLLASLMHHEGRGDWTSVDLLPEEVAAWRAIDPGLDLREADARRLPFPDGTFDACVCISVIEHVPGTGDTDVMAELWRVLRPGGVLHLTTNMAPRPRILTSARPVYGDASPAVAAGGRAFFERHYSEESLALRLLGQPWREEVRERVRERRPVHRLFFRARPWSFALGGLLPLVCARNFAPVTSAATLPDREHAAVYLRLRRPAAGDGQDRRREPGTVRSIT